MITFPEHVERWRSLVEKYADGIPVDFLLAWIKKESAGKLNAKSSMDERGLFQISPSEAKDLKLSSADFDKLLTDGDFSVKTGISLAKKYVARAKSELDKVGTSWSKNKTDFWKMVKLGHGAPAVQDSLLKAFKTVKGFPPPTWDKFERVTMDLVSTHYSGIPTRYRNMAIRTVPNADEVGGAAFGGADELEGSYASWLIPGLLISAAGVALYIFIKR